MMGKDQFPVGVLRKDKPMFDLLDLANANPLTTALILLTIFALLFSPQA